MARLLESWGREREVCQDVGARGGASRPQGEAGGGQASGLPSGTLSRAGRQNFCLPSRWAESDMALGSRG